MHRQIAGTIRVDSVYRYHGLRIVRTPEGRDWIDTDGGLYQVVSTEVRDGRTRQDLILYLGIDGPDAGQYFVCTPSDFVQRFRTEETAIEVEPVEKPPEKAAGRKEGSGL